MKRMQQSAELVNWVNDELTMSTKTFDELKNGVALIQLIHKIAPDSFDLARCDFLASTPYHYEKNFKLLQEVMERNQISRNFVIERVMEGDKQRDLFHFVSYLKLHFSTFQTQHENRIEDEKKKRLTKHAIASFTSTSTKKPPRPPSTPPSAAASPGFGRIESTATLDGSTPADEEFTTGEYDPVAERKRAQAARKKIMTNRSIGDIQSLSDGSRSRYSTGVLGTRHGMPLRLHRNKPKGKLSGSILQWANSVQSPQLSSRCTTPSQGRVTPTEGEGDHTSGTHAPVDLGPVPDSPATWNTPISFAASFPRNASTLTLGSAVGAGTINNEIVDTPGRGSSEPGGAPILRGSSLQKQGSSPTSGDRSQSVISGSAAAAVTAATIAVNPQLAHLAVDGMVFETLDAMAGVNFFALDGAGWPRLAEPVFDARGDWEGKVYTVAELREQQRNRNENAKPIRRPSASKSSNSGTPKAPRTAGTRDTDTTEDSPFGTPNGGKAASVAQVAASEWDDFDDEILADS